MNEHLSKSFKKLTDSAHEAMHDYVMNMMESDTKFNFADMVRRRVNDIMKGLLSGGWQEAVAKKWLDGYDFEKFRLNVYLAHTETIHNKLIDELVKENKSLKESLEFARRY